MRKKQIVLQNIWLVFILSILSITGCGSQKVLNRISNFWTGLGKAGYDIYVEDEYAYVTTNDGVVIFDVSNQKSPNKVGEILTGTAFGVVVEDGFAYIASGNKLVVADVSDPLNPQQLGKYNTKGATSQVRVEGSYAYIASSMGLEIVDISESGKPKSVAQLKVANVAMGIEVFNNLVYLAVANSGLLVIDVTDPSSPRKIKTVSDTDGAWDIHIHGEFLYLGCHGKGIRILSLDNKESPQIIGRFNDNADDDGEAQGVWGDGEYLYIADNYGIEVLDIKDPTNPIEIGEYGAVSAAHDLYVEGNLIYVVEGLRSLLIFEFNPNP